MNANHPHVIEVLDALLDSAELRRWLHERAAGGTWHRHDVATHALGELRAAVRARRNQPAEAT